MTPDGDKIQTLETMTNQYDGEMIVAPGSGHQVWINKPANFNPEMAMIVKDVAG